VWDGPDAADLAGYHVYRESGGRRQRMTAEPVTVTFYRDEAVVRGARYLYLVSSVDTLGNESAPVAAPEVLLPR
jgi:fibronectin type 3 domain-containing protein